MSAVPTPEHASVTGSPEPVHLPDTWHLGIDFGGTKVALGVADDAGELLHVSRFISAGLPMSRVMAMLRDHLHALVGDGVPRSVGVSTPGVVEEHGVRYAPNNQGWESLPLVATLRDICGANEVHAVTDVKAAALAEATDGALADSSCGIYLNLGTGLAAAILIGGRVLLGAHGVAGEIAYQSRHGRPRRAAPDEAPLEEFASGQGIADQVTAALGRRVTTAEAFTRANTDAAVGDLVRTAVRELSDHVADLAVALDADTIAIGGGMVEAPSVLDAIADRVECATLHPPMVTLAAHPHDAPLRGALIAARRPAQTPVWL